MFPILSLTIPVGIVTIITAVIVVIVGAMNKDTAERFHPLEVVRSGVHFVMLVAVVLAALQIAFAAVNHFIPDALVGNGGRSEIIGFVRVAVATLCVAGPLFLIALYASARRAAAKITWSMRFMVALVLLLVALTLAGTLVTLIYNFLSGELGMRLVGKAAAILVMALATGAYYRVYLTQHAERTLMRATKIFMAFIIIVIVKQIVVGIILGGGPMAARLERYDDRRLQDISSIQSVLESYATRTRTLPRTLAELPDLQTLTDPKTGTAYEYRPGAVTQDEAVLGVQGTTTRLTASFELCATFETERTEDAGAQGKTRPIVPGEFESLAPYYSDTTDTAWNHPQGHYCFARTIHSTQPVK